ncbi:hypothetical protein FRC02_011946 [Tulasnella sp. 418]|nr:hypothetical protein FRC02_011946 [Tulasnella sp. 418]
MKFTAIASLFTFVIGAQAHTHIWGIWVNDVFQGDGRNIYIRSPPNNNPVKDLNSGSMACNVNNRNVPTTVSVKGGDRITFEWYHDSRGDDILATSHKGPAVVYIAPTSSNGGGSVWVKLAQENYNGQWPTDKIIAAKGKHTFTLPNIAAGDYLLRPELLTLHEADTTYDVNSARGIQLYMNCVQIRITSSGGSTLPSGVSFPGAYKYSDPGIKFNLYSQAASSYIVPGPSVWTPGSGGGSTGGGGTAPAYGQCGGQGWTGATSCVSGYKCQVSNEYYSQCVPA